jgi:hypothetical protein
LYITALPDDFFFAAMRLGIRGEMKKSRSVPMWRFRPFSRKDRKREKKCKKNEKLLC